LLLAAGAARAIVQGRRREQAAAVLGAVTLFSLARLPSGNLWDAMLDPLLWAWALVAVLLAAVRAVRRASSAAAARAPEPALQAAGAEPFSPIKE